MFGNEQERPLQVSPAEFEIPFGHPSRRVAETIELTASDYINSFSEVSVVDWINLPQITHPQLLL